MKMSERLAKAERCILIIFHSCGGTKADFPAPFRDLNPYLFRLWFIRNLKLLGIKEDFARLRLAQVLERAKEEEEDLLGLQISKTASEMSYKCRRQATKLMYRIETRYEQRKRHLERCRRTKKHEHWVELEEQNRRRDELRQIIERLASNGQKGARAGLVRRLLWCT
jgi:hypothetical protein